VKAFLDSRGCGTNNWIAPEIDKKCQSQFFFRLDPLYHCRRCFGKNSVVESTQSYASDFTRADICERCKEQIFEFYRKTDIYSLGLVFWSILKAVMGSYSGFHTEQVSGIASYFEHPLDVTTSQNFVAEMSKAVSQITKLDTVSQNTQQQTIDGSNIADTSSILYNEVSRDCRRRDFQQLKDPKILKIYEITIQCLNPNPYERPSATELFEELEIFETSI